MVPILPMGQTRLRAPSGLIAEVRCTVRVPRDPPPKPPASTGLGINLGEVWRRAQEKKQKKEPKKP